MRGQPPAHPLLCRLLGAGFATLIPVLPTIFTNFFAERYAGHPIDCQQFPPKEAPPACQVGAGGGVRPSLRSSVTTGGGCGSSSGRDGKQLHTV
jgi:hypothetical protein